MTLPSPSRPISCWLTIFVKDAFLTTFPTSDPNRVLADYLKGVEITGGTGRFEGATGLLSSVFGAADLDLGQITLRYAWTVCFRPVNGNEARRVQPV